MPVQFTPFAERFLGALVEQIEVTPTQFDAAERSYSSLGEWLNRKDSTLASRRPSIYPQGSFRLGTAIRPVNKDDDIDVDLVCEIVGSKSSDTQKSIKQLVGRETKSYAQSKNLSVEPEGNRCWTIRYADSSRFHIDVLPSIPDGLSQRLLLEQANFDAQWADTAIAITDKRHLNFLNISKIWPHSNPRGYAKWFESRCGTELTKSRKAIFEQQSIKVYASLEQIPLGRTKTPLQRAIQILKHHRDVRFGRHSKDKPISIVITTLCAHAYAGESKLADAIFSVLGAMDRYIEDRDGTAWIPNPVDPLENFADKWEYEPAKEHNFYAWLESARDDFEKLASLQSSAALDQTLRENFDPTIVSKTITSIPSPLIRESVIPNSKFEVRPVPEVLKSAPHKKAPIWPIRLNEKYSVEIFDAHAGKTRWKRSKIRSNDKPIKKGYDLYFRARTNVPKPYRVFWQVVNSGAEANALGAKGLRGDFDSEQADEGLLNRKESSQYTGAHSIECFIVKDAALVARSGQFVVNIE